MRRTLTYAVSLCTLLPALTFAAPANAVEAPPKPPTDVDPLTGFAELPNWPIGFIPECVATKPKSDGTWDAHVLAWLPPGAKRIRSLLIIPNNTDSKHIGEYDAVRKVAAKHEMGIVYVRTGSMPAQIQEILDDFATRAKMTEIKYAPWIVQGKSSCGMIPISLAWKFPERMIAGLTYHGETPPWPPEARDPDAKFNGENILWCNLNGESEWGGTWFVHVRPALLNYRLHRSWLPHLAVAKGVGHGDYCDANGTDGWGKSVPDEVQCVDVWDYFAVYIDKALSLRVPADTYPTDGPVELMQVDETKGWLIDPFAVEDLWRQPHYPLIFDEAAGEYRVGKDAEEPVFGYQSIPPAKGYKPPEDVPVVRFEAGISPSNLLWSGAVNSAAERDPKTELGDWANLRPVPGDKLVVAGEEKTFTPLSDDRKGKNIGGISFQHLKKWGKPMTLLTYAVLDVSEPVVVKLEAPYSVAGRLQVVLGGMPVEHKEVVALEKGLYPMLSVLRLDGPNWGGITPHFQIASPELVEQAKALQKDKDALAAERARILKEGIKNKTPVVRPYADVPEERRKHMFWVADEEQARAWFKLHTQKIHGQAFPGP